MGLKIKLCIGFVLVSCSVWSQDEPYIRSFPEKLTVRLGMQNTSNSFTVFNEEDNSEVEFAPNNKTYLGVSFLFRSIELDFGYAPNFLSENQDNDGSRLFTLNFRMFLGQWMQTLDFYNQKGFFANIEGGAIYFPELKTLKIGGSTSRIFNKNFSFRAIGFQNEWQKKSAGSFIPRFTYYYTRFSFENPEALVNTEHTLNLAVGPGYYYNLVLAKHIILGAGGTLGAGMHISSSNGDTSANFLAQAIFRTVLGYNSENFFTGVNLNAQVLAYEDDETTAVADSLSFVEFYLGYRFNAPKKWVEKADKFNKKYGLD
ncbi:DUF4421 domain-containing protein [Muricauda sp. JGD-17]|uniref:DUF4421 domain-containing protein n=1 Tax=Flagellimonas ochracea TaxID=2696472 RepID=A0A964WXF3_9FLAO|nr:DUF4421 family protein [Allomuricauda ochracea]NAY91539.1 DUF4421 domain-containing protein [Allomuricauda ochracea]